MSFTKKLERTSQPDEQSIEFTLYLPSGESWALKSTQLVLIKQEQQITQCRLSCQIDGKAYQSIESQRLFRYDPDTFGAIPSEAFVTELPINLTLLLAPEWLILLEEQVSTVEQAAAYLQNLSREEPTHSLLSTDNWLVLSLEQQQPQGEVKYRTLWDYIDWSAISLDDSEQEADDLLLDAIAHFLKDTIAHQLATDPNYSEANPQVAQATTQLIETLFTVAPSLFSENEAAKDQFVDAIADVFTQSLRSQLTQYLEEAISTDTVELRSQQLSKGASDRQSTSTYSIFEIAVHFFQSENWSVSQVGEQPILQGYFQGKNGRWECYAQAREAEKQFIFYSILPNTISVERRHDIAEYLSRANYGLIIGNFELDFDDGQVRYKTSIGLEDSNLEIGLIKQLVYSNVFTTDKYLPGIMKTIYSNVTPEEAIAQIES